MNTPTTKPTYGELFDSVRTTVPYIVDGLILELTEQIITRMRAESISRSQLAINLNTSPAYVTKLLGGGTNFTLESMVKVAEALDSEIKIEMTPKVEAKDWAVIIDHMFPAPIITSQVWSEKKADRDQAKEPLFGPSFGKRECIQFCDYESKAA